MSNVFTRSAMHVAHLLCLLGPMLVASPITRAGDLLTTTEILLEEQGTKAYVLGYYFGADPHSPLSFTSFVDPSGNSFSYATVPGSTYLGQSLSLAGSGTLDQNGNYDVSATLDFGGKILQIIGKEKESADGHTVQSDDNTSFGGKKTGDTHYLGTIKQPNNTSDITEGWMTDENSDHISKSDFGGTDKLNKDGDWEFTIVPKFANQASPPPSIFSTGFTPVNGGAGDFTVTISPVPEPPAVTMLLLGVLILAFCRKRVTSGLTLTS